MSDPIAWGDPGGQALLDQLTASFATFAFVFGSYYKDLIKIGFSEPHAFELVLVASKNVIPITPPATP